MTRKDYQLVANAIRNSQTDESTLAVMLADTFQATYDNFNRNIFLNACGVSSKKPKKNQNNWNNS